MTKVESTVVSDREISEVFAYASDWRRWTEWFVQVSPFEPVGDIKRGTGARYRYKASMLGIWVTLETEIHDFVEGSGWRGVGRKGLPHTTHWSFEPEGRGTKLTYGIDSHLGVPLLGPVIEHVILRWQWQSIIDRSLQNLKARFPAEKGGNSA